MPHGTKIATCCFCGTRAALVLTGRDRHELSCSACGAPLHNLKMLRSDAVEKGSRKGARTARPHARSPVPTYAGTDDLADWERKALGAPPRNRKKKRRKSLTKRFFEEAFDVIEDIFD